MVIHYRLFNRIRKHIAAFKLIAKCRLYPLELDVQHRVTDIFVSLAYTYYFSDLLPPFNIFVKITRRCYVMFFPGKIYSFCRCMPSIDYQEPNFIPYILLWTILPSRTRKKKAGLTILSERM
jgi:hypothetical protein